MIRSLRLVLLALALTGCSVPIVAPPTPPSAPPPPAPRSPAPPAAPAPLNPALTSVAPEAPGPQPAPPPSKGAPKEAPKARPAAAPSPAPPKAPASPPPVASKPPLDLKTLEQRLKETSAIGVLTKLTLKNQVDELIGRFRAFHQGSRPPTLAELRPSFELLLMKVLSLLQDQDRALASDINASREAIWGMLADPRKLAQFQ